MTIENRDKYLGELGQWWSRAQVKPDTDLGGLASILITQARSAAISGGLTQGEFRTVYNRAIELENKFGEFAKRVGGVKKEQWESSLREKTRIIKFDELWSYIEYGRQRLK